MNMQSSNMSLEDIFLEVTQTKGKNKPSKGTGRKKFAASKPEEAKAAISRREQNNETDNEEEN